MKYLVECYVVNCSDLYTARTDFMDDDEIADVYGKIYKSLSGTSNNLL